jgi:hypothetical protein
MDPRLPLWQRLVITIAVMLATSYIAGLAWTAALNLSFPDYLAGLAGGIAALPVWDFLKRIRPSHA